MIQFYSADISTERASLEEDEFLHCCKVLRHKEGDSIFLSDGKGRTAQGIISDVKKRTAEVEIENVTVIAAKATELVLAVSPLKNRSRWEWLLEKAVELGVDTIIPVLTQRTEKTKINIERSEKIMRSAALQSLRSFHPSLSPCVKFKKLLTRLPAESDKYLAHYNISHDHLRNCQRQHNHGLVLIGPEGDFTPEELSLAKESSFIPVNISDNRLRTETAAITVVQELRNLGY